LLEQWCMLEIHCCKIESPIEIPESHCYKIESPIDIPESRCCKIESLDKIEILGNSKILEILEILEILGSR
jgi:hypothetical protein